MLNLEVADAVQVLEWSRKHIPDAVLAGDGRENAVHITVLFGFSSDVTSDEVAEVLFELVPSGKIVVALKAIGRFEAASHDVLIVHVESPQLVELHYALRDAFGDRVNVTFPRYNPHLSLAYVQKGALPELDGHARFDGDVYVFDSAVYSYPGSTAKVKVSLDTKA